MIKVPPTVTPEDITPEIAELAREIIGQADMSSLTLGYIERALVGLSRFVREQAGE